jgi:hypothetical protein
MGGGGQTIWTFTQRSAVSDVGENSLYQELMFGFFPPFWIFNSEAMDEC